MSICNECWGKGWIKKQGVQFNCRKCKGTGVIENEPQTNEEWLRTLPADEQVKEVLSRGFMTEKRTAEDFVEWLKEIHHA